MNDLQTSFSEDVIEVKKMGFLKRVTGVIFSPGKLMDNLVERPRLIFPLIMIAVAQLALQLIRLPLYLDFLRKSAENSSGFTESIFGITMTPEIIESSINSTATKIYYMTPLTSLFSWVFMTVIFFAIFKIFGGKGKFKQYLSITGYAYVITALSLLLTLVVSYFTGSLHMDLPITSIASLLSNDLQGNFFYGVSKGIEIFSIWYLAVIAIGFSAVTGFKKKTVYYITAGVFIVTLIITGIYEVATKALI